MVDVTLLEVNLEDAEFTANAPFSGREGKSKAGSKVSKMLKRSGGPESTGKSGSALSKLTTSEDDDSEAGLDVEITDGDSEDNPASFVPVVLLGALVAAVVVLRRLRRSRSEGQRELVEYEA